MDHNCYATPFQSKQGCLFNIIYVFNYLYLDKMISRAERTKLVLSPFFGFFRDPPRICIFKTTSIFGGRKIIPGSITPFKGPYRTFLKNIVEFFPVQSLSDPGTQTAWNVRKNAGRQGMKRSSRFL